MKRTASTPASGYRRTISERICARISWSCFAHAVESAWMVSVPSENLPCELRVPACLAGEVCQHVAHAARVAPRREGDVLVVLGAAAALAVRPGGGLQSAQTQVGRDRLRDGRAIEGSRLRGHGCCVPRLLGPRACRSVSHPCPPTRRGRGCGRPRRAPSGRGALRARRPRPRRSPRPARNRRRGAPGGRGDRCRARRRRRRG